jgi:glutamate-1-semialdehyde 2,1-aminomutase
MSRRLAEGLLELAKRFHIALQVNRAGSMLTAFFSERPIRCRADALSARRDRFAHWVKTLRRHGILVPPSPDEALFLSTAHTPRHIDRLLTASEAAFASMR